MADESKKELSNSQKIIFGTLFGLVFAFPAFLAVRYGTPSPCGALVASVTSRQLAEGDGSLAQTMGMLLGAQKAGEVMVASKSPLECTRLLFRNEGWIR